MTSWLGNIIWVFCLGAAGAIIYKFFEDVFKELDMGDKSAVDSLKEGTAIVVVSFIAKSGQRQGYTFHNVTPEALQAALSALDKPEFMPMQTPAYETELDGTVHAVNPNE